MAGGCQCSAVAAVTMIALVLAAAIATLTSVITAEVPLTPGKNCYRKCIGEKRTCHFHFDVHTYQTMSRACYNCPGNITDCQRPDCIAGDGVPRKILVVNKQLPGPPIQVCEGDTVIVDVQNRLHADGLTIHWHGQTMKAGTTHPGTPHMDGTPGITQCPIPPGSSFKYSFVAREAGTQFYHAHTGFHRGDGVFGPMIVRQRTTDDPNYSLFDYDIPGHVLLIHDWLHMPTEDKFIFRHHSGGDDFPESMLINGQGPHQHSNKTSPAAHIPYRQFTVTPGNRYRMRLINAAILNCPITVSVEDHMLTVIATDGNPVKPLNASSIVVYPGERWDVVLAADCRKSGTFWMSFMGGVDCAVSFAHQFSLLRYRDDSSACHPGDPSKGLGNASKGLGNAEGVKGEELIDAELLAQMSPKPKFTEVPPAGVQVNSINSACYDDLVCMANMRSIHSMPEDMKTPTNFTFYLAFEMRRINNAHYYSRMYYDFNLVEEDQQIPTPQVNNLTFLHPATPLLLGGDQGTPICNAENPPPTRNCQEDFCECLHMYHIPLGASVELVLIDEGQYGDENHPIHLHGQHFWVVGQDRPVDLQEASLTRNEVIKMDQRGDMIRNFDHPVYKDTVTIPDAGYTIIRFKADNPGHWLLHCHLLFHSMAGMNIVFKVGEDTDIPPAPEGFPTCANYEGST
ncbi:hypothetical protein Pcinc_011312 [Petrolisthes cinctipes]|uniref:Laccase n=1 Tax=Petrolisthes cinctipes TaxID=88211 RepID=A0AAE1KTJ0_PETCI|nr:hypothetical protein Pcinc_011312 [Petrolisthes cinctipes]